jgi:hypothetical protein
VWEGGAAPALFATTLVRPSSDHFVCPVAGDEKRTARGSDLLHAHHTGQEPPVNLAAAAWRPGGKPVRRALAAALQGMHLHHKQQSPGEVLAGQALGGEPDFHPAPAADAHV